MRITNVMERPSSRESLASWYVAVLEEQEASGLSVAEYADEVGVSAATLYQWRRRLASTDEARYTATDPSEPGLIEVVLGSRRTEAARDRPTMLTVQLGQSRAIEVSADFDAEALQRLVHALESC